ncbi:MAG: hypothetical protein ACJ746_27710 [Bryobacteraceae bacterium]
MGQGIVGLLAAWANFYVVVGSAAGALTGLQFVVMTLISSTRQSGSVHEIRAFGTPTVVHFCAALLLSGIMTAPWPELSDVDLCLGMCGVGGLIYSVWIVSHARKARYVPDAGDWIWYVAVPVVAYVALVTIALLFWWNVRNSLFAVGAVCLIFLFLGIHNAWDTVTYLSIKHWMRAENEQHDPRNEDCAT